MNLTNISLADDRQRMNISVPKFEDMCSIAVGSARDANAICADESYMSIRVFVPIDPTDSPYFSRIKNKSNVAIDCRGETESGKAASKECWSVCEGGDKSSGCPEMSEGGGLYLMHDTCDEFKREDYSVCLELDTAAQCGYHVRTNKGTQDSKCVQALPSCWHMPSGARIWPGGVLGSK